MGDYDRRQLLAAGAVSLGAASGASAQSVGVEVQTHAYSTPPKSDQPLLLDLYRPVGAKAPLPVVVFAHGGGFVLGSRKTAPDLSRYFAQAGIAMASIDYRLAPNISFPENVVDVRTSVRWLRLNARRLGLDPARIGLWGTSAGAYLVTMAGVLPPDLYAGTEYLDQSSAVSCVLDGYGPADFAATTRLRLEEQPHLEPVIERVASLPNPMVEDAKSMTPEIAAMFSRVEEIYLGAPLDTIPEKVKAANPMTYVSKDTPPFLIMHGLADRSVPHGNSVMLYEALAKADARATLRLVHGLPHTFFNMPGIDGVAGPFGMEVRSHVTGRPETRSVETRMVFDVAGEFFKAHLT